MILHVTNGDVAAEKLRAQFPKSPVLPWRDVLHAGPVPPGLPLPRLSEVRARFLADAGWTSYAEAIRQFRQRDTIIVNALRFDETVLWFERDLYDALQLLQVLDCLHEYPVARASLVVIKGYFGGTTPMALGIEYGMRKPITRALLASGSAAWHAFRDPDPRALEPHLEKWPALVRLCEEHPWTTDGLSRTERSVGQLQKEGVAGFRDLFSAFNRTEDPVWMGDAPFKRFLEGARDRDPNYLWDPDNRCFRPRTGT